MKLLFPELIVQEEHETLTYVKKLYVTKFEFNTVLLLQNWPDRFIITVRLFGFGFTKVWIYE